MKSPEFTIIQPQMPLEINGKYKIYLIIKAIKVPGVPFPSERSVSKQSLVQQMNLQNEFLSQTGKK